MTTDNLNKETQRMMTTFYTHLDAQTKKDLFSVLKNTTELDFSVLCKMAEMMEQESPQGENWLKYIWILEVMKKAYKID